jgi:cytochrome c2
MKGGLVAPIVLVCFGLASCDYFLKPAVDNKFVQGGDAARGLALISGGAFGCAACHTIPGVRAPKGVVGPPLGGMAQRSFIAGQFPNKPAIMVAFLQNPPAFLQQTGMPNVGLTTEEARHMAAYLYTLKQPDVQ